MPFALLSEYLKDVAILFGEETSVHLIRIDAGSTVPVLQVEHEAIPKVNQRLRLGKDNEAPEELL